MRIYIFLFSILFPYFVLSQNLKTTEINVVEGLQVSVPQANKLNVKASYQDTTKIDKTQNYSFIDKYLFSKFKTRALSAAKIKKKLESKNNFANIYIATGNRERKCANFNYSGKFKEKLIYGLGFLYDSYSYKTKADDIDVTKDNFEFYLYTKSIFKNGILNSKLAIQDISEFHQFSAEESPAKTYSEFSASFDSRSNKDDEITHTSQVLLKDFNNQIENQIGLYSDISKTIDNIPISLSLEYNNYINYSNHDSSVEVDKLDVKILDVTPNVSLEKNGFGFDLGFNLGIDNEGGSMDIFPIIDINKELVDNVINLSFGIDRDDYRNTLSSLTEENPYIHTPGINTSTEDSIGYFHELETTDIYECYINLDNKLSSNEILTFNFGYGKLVNLHYFYFDYLKGLNRFSVDYLDTWQLRAKAIYKRKFNNILSLNIDANYKWFSEEISGKTNLEANLSVPVAFGNKIKFIPSVNYIGERKYSYMSGLLIEPPQIDFGSLEDRYLANLEIFYSYNDKFNFSFTINNILDDQKPHWYGYDLIGINFNLGLNYIF